jgi:carbon-monoxide dehydrogenase medium subunit
MKPAAFEVIRAGSVAEISRLLVEAEGSAKPVAGAQSLGPMLNLRLSQPRFLVDVTGIAEMTRVEETETAVTLGACITTASIEDGRIPSRGLQMLPKIAAGIAYRAVRNRGTIGGSLCHADPAADWLTTLCALGAECLIAGPNGRRRMPVDEFMTSAFEVALATGEVLDGISIPRVSPSARWGFNKICRKTGEFASAIAAALYDPERQQFRAVMGATSGRPIVIRDANDLLDGPVARPEGIKVAAIIRFLDDYGVTERTARHHHLAALQRATLQARLR